jgi:hypothetical protein
VTKRFLSPPAILLLALLPSCIDTGDEPVPCEVDETCGDDDDAVEDVPNASVSVSELDLGVVCATTEAAISISNDGTAPLIIVDVTVDGNWTVVSAPTEVPAGARADIVVSGSGGAGTLEIETNDTEHPLLTVALSATANQPPTVSLATAPAVMPPGATYDFTGVVEDDVQDPSTLSLEWSSDVDGVLSTSPADDTGLATYTWEGSAQQVGSHVVTLTATDACGAETLQTLTVCQNMGYTEESAALDTWQFTGSAVWDPVNEWVELTDTRRYIRGTAFQTSEIVASDNVSIGFLFFASGGSSTGADGLSLTAIDTTRMTTYAGEAGGALGYGSLPGWAVEVDTWDNTGDPGLSEPMQQDHVSFVIDGASDGIGEVSAGIPEVEDGLWHEMQVDVDGQHVTVSIDDVIYIDETVAALATFPAHIGFTAATGNITNNHLIDSLSVKRFVCE